MNQPGRICRYLPSRSGLLAMLAGIAALAAAQSLPTAEYVLDRFVEATGGKAAYEKLHNEEIRGTVTVAGAALGGTVVSRAAAPNKSRTVMEIAGLGTMEEGTDGAIAWELSAVQGPRIKTGEELAAALREAAFNAPVRWRELYAKAEVAGVEEIEGRPCYKVLLTPPVGKPVTHYYDRESGLLAKVAMVAASPMGDVPVEIFMGDYREVAGVRVPHSLRQRVISQEIRIAIESVRYNIDLPANAFEPPAEVRALTAKPKP